MRGFLLSQFSHWQRWQVSFGPTNTALRKVEDHLAVCIYSGSQITVVSFIGLYAIAQTDKSLLCEHEAPIKPSPIGVEFRHY